LCITRAVTVLENVPEISRKRLDTTRPFDHFSNVQWMASISESVVDRPGLPQSDWREGDCEFQQGG